MYYKILRRNEEGILVVPKEFPEEGDLQYVIGNRTYPINGYNELYAFGSLDALKQLIQSMTKYDWEIWECNVENPCSDPDGFTLAYGAVLCDWIEITERIIV